MVDRTERVQHALARLEAEDRLILRLRFEEGLSVPEVARVLHLGSPFRLYRRIDRILTGPPEAPSGPGHRRPHGLSANRCSSIR